MPPTVIIEPSSLDFSRVLLSREEIGKFNPQRFEFQLLDGVVLMDHEARKYAGYYDAREDAWWVRGHIPGRPIMPGVVMIECAAQMASLVAHHLLDDLGFLGFSGVSDVKFRGVVTPPARFILVGQALEVKRRRVICATQGFVDGEMVYEGVITGMPI
ncbi:MAG: beta-hydroxyacyl-ACP dehydratase [Planctomycetia bacterium]|nr:MAG: beta-hydroxyacyl-ACP dehydratase [Planctomycetia bacterium]